MNQIVAIDEIDRALADISTPSDVMEFISKLDTLKKLLDAADRFNAMARKYAQLEAGAYVRIAELGLTDSIPTGDYRCTVALWVAGLSDEERLGVVCECGEEGMTIRAYWKNRVHEPEMEKRAVAAYCREAGYAVQEFVEHGVVNLNEHLAIRNKPDEKRIPEIVRKGVKDKVRDRIRSLGGHGLGDGSGVYVDAAHADGYADKLIDTKLKSMRLDMLRLVGTLRELESIGGYKTTNVITRKRRNSYELSEDGALNVALSLLGFGNPHFDCGEEVAAKLVAQMCDDLGWPVNRIRQVIIDEFVESNGYGRTTGMHLIGLRKNTDTNEWYEERYEV